MARIVAGAALPPAVDRVMLNSFALFRPGDAKAEPGLQARVIRRWRPGTVLHLGIAKWPSGAVDVLPPVEGRLVVGAGLDGWVADASRGGLVCDGGPQPGLLAGDEVDHDVADTRVTLGLFGAAARLFLADQRVHLGAVHGGRALGGPDQKEMGVAARRG